MAYCLATMNRLTGHTNNRVIAVLAFLVIVLPLLIVQLIPTDSPGQYAFEATVDEEVGRATSNQLVYYSVNAEEGTYPARDMVVAIDRGYTRGALPEDLRQNHAYWFQGGIMTPDVFYGDQYLFYDKPQVYVRQVKSGLLWPDQLTELRVLYLSPLSTLAAPVQLPMLIRSEELTDTLAIVLLARLMLLLALVIFVIRLVRKKHDVLLPVLIYAVLAILLTIFILGDLY